MKYSGRMGGTATGERRSSMRAKLASAFWEMGKDAGRIPLRLSCLTGHRWVSQIDPGSEDRAGVVDPNCPICQEFYTEYHIVRGTVDESIECVDRCWKADQRTCVCSCGGLNHGIARVIQSQSI
jgi:hypothetical protein